MLKNHLFWDLSKALLSVVIISSIAIAIAMGIATAHDPSEMGGGAHTHQLPPPWPYHAMMVFTGFISLAGGVFTARYLKQRKGWVEYSNSDRKIREYAPSVASASLSPHRCQASGFDIKP
jgi:formate hydrogenlyase subunit 3/multisubunit Na+/H+ antiporter MnhD subunit